MKPQGNRAFYAGEVGRQLRKHSGLLAAIYIPAAVVLLTCWMVSTPREGKRYIGNFLQDPAQIASLPFYTGIVSNLGVLAWSGTAAICLALYVMLKRAGYPPTSEWRRFFLMSGILTAMLVTDDLFMIHEQVVPRFLFPKRGWFPRVPEGAVFMIYLVYAVFFIRRCFDTIITKTDFALLGLGLGGLCMSVGADKLGLKHIVTDKGLRLFIEDGTKFLGILAWSAYFMSTALRVGSDLLLENRSAPEVKQITDAPA